MVRNAVNYFVQRTCTEINPDESTIGKEGISLLLEDLGTTGAYVLLGAPGSGKTTEFLRQAEQTGGSYVTARDFRTFDDNDTWHGTTLFIDALDEIRAGSADGRTPLDAIRTKLASLGSPKFRLSCREADWFGSNDRHHLAKVAPDQSVRVLHLDPLSEGDAKNILQQNFGFEVPGKFIRLARERGVDGLLINPQSLGMLARAVKNDNWPRSRTETFELACRQLLRELNQEHLIAEPEVADTSGLMLAAGKLFAVQLLTGSAGYERLHGQRTQDYLALEEIPEASRNTHRRALRTKLFEAPDGDRALPAHRQIAEFVAARYLSNRIEDGLSPGRILALMTGHDGELVKDMRGLCAWLAALSQSSRADIVARDPLGTVLYGDVQGFSVDEKRQILDHLEQCTEDNQRLIWEIRMDSQLGDLIFPGVEDLFRDRTLDSKRDDRRQSFVLLLVEMFVHGKPLEGVAPRLMDIIRDETWWPRIRDGAIDAFVRQRGDRSLALNELKALAQDVYREEVLDPDDNLLGSLLDSLYPEELSESEILGYLRAPKRSGQFLAYEYFWGNLLAKRSSCDQMTRLLDSLVAIRDRLSAEAQKHGWRKNTVWRVPTILLKRFLTSCDKEPDPDRLFGWLGVAGWVDDLDIDIEDNLYKGDGIGIGAWIGDRPDLLKSLVALELKHCIEQLTRTNGFTFDQLMQMEWERRLFSAPRPKDFASWCLDQAVMTDNRMAAAWLMHQVADAIHHSNGKEVSVRVVEARITGNTFLQHELKERLDTLKTNEEASQEVQERPAQRLMDRQLEWQALIRNSQIELRENRANLPLLHRLGTAYLGGYGNVFGRTHREMLRNLLGDDEELVESVLAGLRGTVFREDLPSDEEVICLSVQQRMHYLSYPFLAGLNEIFLERPDGDICLDINQLRLALAMHYNISVWAPASENADGKPRWFAALLNAEPKLVADILVKTARSWLHNGHSFSKHLYDLAHSADHKTVACLAALPILKSFPVRCGERQLSSLKHVLLAACLYCKRKTLVELIEKKLASRSMNVAQRVYWLNTGLIVHSELFLKNLESYVAGNARRIRRLSEFYASTVDMPGVLIQQLDVASLSLLIRLIGATHRPYTLDSDSDEGGRVTPGMEAAFRVYGMIGQLANDSSGEATEHLKMLSVNDTLVAWRPQLIVANSRQNAIRRDATFTYVGAKQVVDLLNNNAPANAADLAALIMEQLGRTARFTRNGNTSAWRTYWNVDSYNHPVSPKPENACRDELLADLQHRLAPRGIDAQREGSYTDDKRADIRVSYGGFNIPVEIKKSCHKDLWSAVRKQLIAKYTRDPDTDGHGIYVVFWFGDTEHCRPTPGIDGIPTSAADLEQRLYDGLSTEERRKITICMIDVAKSHDSDLSNTDTKNK